MDALWDFLMWNLRLLGYMALGAVVLVVLFWLVFGVAMLTQSRRSRRREQGPPGQDHQEEG